MGNRLTGDIGYTLRVAYALEHHPNTGTAIEVCHACLQRQVHHQRAVRAVRHQPQMRAQVAGAPRAKTGVRMQKIDKVKNAVVEFGHGPKHPH